MQLFETDIIEGIGNEVLLTVTTVACITIIAVHFVTRCVHRNSNIHPLNQEAVVNARQQLSNLFSNRLIAESEIVDGDGVISPVQHFGMDNQCPVCLNEPRFPIETNCGHLFCAQCIIVYWHHGNWRGPVRCPVCRQQVSVLLQCFPPNPNVGEEEQEERARILHEVNDYNRRFSGEPRPWLDYLWDLPTLLRHLSSEFFTVGGLMYMFRIRIVLCFVAAIMYLISPLDMIPEAVFGLLGLLDDLFVVLLLAIYVTIIYRRFLANRWEDE